MGCFWGAERKFWELGDGIYTTAVGYAAGLTPNPTYEEVCSGRTGHNEVVLVAYDPKKIAYEQLLKTFWENHDPTQGMRQGNDIGTQYRSGIYTTSPAQNSTSRRIHQATAGWAAPACRVRSAPACQRTDQRQICKRGRTCGPSPFWPPRHPTWHFPETTHRHPRYAAF
jgi:methionine-S-sulfoxide reductase